MARILLLGFEGPISDQLLRVLSQLHHRAWSKSFSEDWLKHVEADVMFCSGDDPRFRDALRTVRFQRPSLPFVVATRLPEVKAWLDALDAGASDYCAAPFELAQIRWIMESVLPQQARYAVV